MNRSTAEALQERPLETSPAFNAPEVPAEWRVTGAAVQGVSHQRLGLPCQDAQGYQLLPDGTLIVALADGAGSARFSDQGANRAVDQMLSGLIEALERGQPEDETGWAGVLYVVFDAVREAVLQLAQADEECEEIIDDDVEDMRTARDYATTLTCVIATSDRLVVGQIGDGAVIAGNDPTSLFAATRLQRGEYANETHFLTQDDALDQLVIENIDGRVDLLAVMSDGLIRLALKLPDQQPHTPFFQPLFRFTEAVGMDEESAAQAREHLAGFLTSERVNARTDDDKSLVLAVRVSQAGSEKPDMDNSAGQPGQEVEQQG